jgi:hypothetical protein
MHSFITSSSKKCSETEEDNNKKRNPSGTHEKHEIEIKTTSNVSDKNSCFWMYIDINEINQKV